MFRKLWHHMNFVPNKIYKRKKSKNYRVNIAKKNFSIAQQSQMITTTKRRQSLRASTDKNDLKYERLKWTRNINKEKQSKFKCDQQKKTDTHIYMHTNNNDIEKENQRHKYLFHRFVISIREQKLLTFRVYARMLKTYRKIWTRRNEIKWTILIKSIRSMSMRWNRYNYHLGSRTENLTKTKTKTPTTF